MVVKVCLIIVVFVVVMLLLVTTMAPAIRRAILRYRVRKFVRDWMREHGKS
jgi:hypothetical protein